MKKKHGRGLKNQLDSEPGRLFGGSAKLWCSVVL